MSILHVGPGQEYSVIQNAINNAKPDDTVCVPEGTYILNDRLIIKSGIKLQGAGCEKTIFKGEENTGGAKGVRKPNGWIYCDGISNFEICDLKFISNATGVGDGGHGETRNCILLRKCSDVQISNLNFQRYLYNDGIKCQAGNNVIISNCLSSSVVHDFVEFLGGTKNSKVSNCKIDVQTNMGIRLDNASNCLLSIVLSMMTLILAGVQLRLKTFRPIT
ncbi:MAG TPA: hypothetical protein HA262_13985 [Methanosarcina sp.]|nr:hypothetical protein [Methanosarcina sp.]